MQNTQRQQQQQQNQQAQQRQNNHGPVEHRKLTQRFRQFLADEEKFWTQLVLRLRRLFDLDEAQPALIALGLLGDPDDVSPAGNPGEGVETRDGPMHVSSGRNHFQFPVEDAATSCAPTSPEERESRLAILTKALICLGDIARYRELYNESNGRPKAGHEADAGPTRRGRNRRGGAAGAEVPPRPRNYDKAQQCYEQARLLVSYDGNPSHQLAILASYQKDSFTSLIHYYRALCVRQPYDTAAENLGTVLSKALESWRQRMRREREKGTTNDAQLPPRVRIEAFKEKVVVLHALWRVGMDKGVDKMFSISPKHDEKVFKDFYALVSERHLPIDLISSTIVLSQGALWKHRMIRDDSSTSHHRKQESVPAPAGTSTIIEWKILNHLLDLHLALLEVGKDELKDPPPMEGVDDLAQRISATFRRTLPALRIASKWLRANFKYVAQDQEFASEQQKDKVKGLEVYKRVPTKISGNSTKTTQFWKVYAQFILALSLAFPSHKLPSFVAPLEEDIEMRGFLPLKNMMGETKTATGGEKLPVGLAQPREQVHPNVEQLMRIADLLDDAKALVAMENTPLLLINNHIMFNPEAVEDHRTPSHTEISHDIEDPVVPIRQQQLLATIRDTSLGLLPQRDPDDDNMTELTSRTDDDVVRDAFKFLNAEEEVELDDGEDEEIVWDPRAISPTLSPTLHATPMTPVRAMLSPPNVSPRSPIHYQPKAAFSASVPAPPFATTTAQDLLNDVMGVGVGRSLGGGNLLSPTESTAPQPKFLFGSELSHRQSQSIWSAARDEQPLRYTGNGNTSGHIYQTPPRQYAVPPAQDLSQHSTWPSSYSQSQNSQQSLVGALPSAPFAQAPHSMVVGGGGGGGGVHHHHRVPSASVAPQLFPSHAQVQHDPFGYPTSLQQQRIRKSEHHHLSLSPGYFNSSLGPEVGGFGLGPGVGGAGQFYSTAGPSYHPQHQMLDPRVAQQSYLTPAVSHLWSNMG
ncbi:hypothetical protein B0H34DRAFT_662751 [Crassisporium funariophilum]|nr:hypothetical protein B0H34DRAFT_662751 [Crassisporium funariophilum]